MREIQCAVVDIDRYLEEAARAKHQLDAEHWRNELRPRAMRLFTARTMKLTWSRALVKLIAEELFPDDLSSPSSWAISIACSRGIGRTCSQSRSHFATAGDVTVWRTSPGACACP